VSFLYTAFRSRLFYWKWLKLYKYLWNLHFYFCYLVLYFTELIICNYYKILFPSLFYRSLQTFSLVAFAIEVSIIRNQAIKFISFSCTVKEDEMPRLALWRLIKTSSTLRINVTVSMSLSLEWSLHLSSRKDAAKLVFLHTFRSMW